MKSKKWIGIIIVILGIGIIGWFWHQTLKTENYSNKFIYVDFWYYPHNSKGFYYQDKDWKWNFFDVKTKKYAPLCNKPNCNHKDIQTCDAYLIKDEVNLSNTLLADEENIYIIHEKNLNEMDIWKANLDGSDIVKIGYLTGEGIMGVAKMGNKLYLNAAVPEKNRKGLSYVAGGGKIEELDLETLDTKLLTNKELDINKVDVIFGADEEGIYYIEGIEDIRRPYWLYYYKNKTEEVTQLTGENEQILRIDGEVCYLKKRDEEKRLYQMNLKTREVKEWFPLPEEMDGVELLDIYDDMVWIESGENHWYWTEGMKEPQIFPYKEEFQIKGASEDSILFVPLKDRLLYYILKEDFYKGDLSKAVCIMEEGIE